MVWQRCLTALVGIPLAIVLVYLGGIPFFIAVLILSILGLYEFFNILISPEVGIIFYYAFFCGIAWQIAVYLKLNIIPQMLLVFFLCGLIIYILNFQKIKLQDFTLAILGVAYIFGLFNYVLRLRLFLPYGHRWLLLALILIWSNDTGAFFIGRSFGKRKLHKLVSPKKTIEGAIGGIAVTGVVALALNLLFHYMSFSQSILLGVMTAVLGIFGDLWESGIKRVAGVKDSGTIFPGHGGVLDRFDSLLFAAPVIYYYIQALLN